MAKGEREIVMIGELNGMCTMSKGRREEERKRRSIVH